MNPATISVETPVEQVIQSRPALVRLAQEVFDRKSPSLVRAFGQFAKSQDIGDLINAKREGIFNYGAAFYETGSGVAFPTSVEAILSALHKAQAGEEVSLTDIAAMYGGVNEDTMKLAVEHGPKILGKSPAAAATPKVETKATPKEEPKVETQEPVVQAENVRQFRRATEPKAETPESGGDQTDLVTQIKELRQSLADVLEKISEDQSTDAKEMFDDLTHLKSRVYAIEGVLGVIAENQEAINANISTLAQYLDPGAELKNVQTPLFDTSSPETQQVEPVREEVTKRFVSQAEPEAREPAQTTGGEAGDLTPEYVKGLELAELRELAGKLGVKDAHKIAFPKVARRKIHAAMGWPPVSE